MKILVVTTKSPYPLNEGRALRTYNLIREMTRLHEVHLVSFVQDALDVNGIDHMRELCSVVEAVPLYMGAGRLKLLGDVLREPFGPAPLPVRKYLHSRMRATLRRLHRAHRYDLVHLDMLHLAGYLDDLTDVPVLLMEHNVEAQILARRADNEQHPVKRAYLRYQERKLRAYEARACARADAVVAVSDVDAQQLNEMSGRTDVVCVPNGVDTAYFAPPAAAAGPAAGQPPTLVYVGGFTWFPNLDAIDHFRRDILPLVKARVPGVKVKVIGRYADNALVRDIQSDPAIELCGLVDDIRPHVHAAQAYIVPLRIGGGTRLKILDALSMGKAIVSTAIGCEGLQVVDGEHILVADSPAAFADTLVRVLSDAALVQRLSDNGRRLAEQVYDWRAVGLGLARAYEAAVARGRRAPTHPSAAQRMAAP